MYQHSFCIKKDEQIYSEQNTIKNGVLLAPHVHHHATADSSQVNKLMMGANLMYSVGYQ